MPVILAACWLAHAGSVSAESAIPPADEVRLAAERVVANLLERDFMYYGEEALHYGSLLNCLAQNK